MRKWFLGLVKKDHKYVLTNWKPNAECNANASRMQALLELLKFHTKSTQLGPLDASYQYQEIEAQQSPGLLLLSSTRTLVGD